MLVLAFAAIYVVWGSTYLAIRMVVETFPAFLSAATRFVIAGGLLMLALIWSGVSLPSRAQWRHSAISGTLMLVGGNGLVVWAEKSISSGLAAVLVALAPVWFALLDWLRPGGTRPTLKTLAGIAVGFGGVVILVNSRGIASGESANLLASAAVIVAGICWAAGSLYSKHMPNIGSPWMNAAAQMICGGTGLAVVGHLAGETAAFNWSSISARSLWALVYLIVFGSWIGYSAYVWLLKVVPASRVSTYAYVNPVIAVLLGWAVLGESVTLQMMGGALVVIAGVAIISMPQSALASVGRFWRRDPARSLAAVDGVKRGAN